MTRRINRISRLERSIPVHSESSTGGVMELPLTRTVPAELLDGGETVLFALKPSAWFVLLISARWLAASIVLAALSVTVIPVQYYWYTFQAAILIAAARLGWATLEWVARLYVLTNRRVMSIRGVVAAEIYAAQLRSIEEAAVIASPGERTLRVGSVVFASSSNGRGAWEIVSRPAEMHERLQHAIRQSRNGRGGLGG